MRAKELKLIITFHTTADAMGMEKACKEAKAPGRLIPVPRAISSGCGLAWCASVDREDSLRSLMERNSLHFQGIYICMV